MTPPDRDGTPTPPPPVHDRRLYLALVLASVAVHAWVIGNTSVTARDSIGFARYALNLGDPNAGRDGLPPRTRVQLLTEEKHPPGYPTAVYLASLVVRPVYPAGLPEQMLRSAQVASAAAAVLLVFPLFRLGRLVFDRTVGFWSALLFQLLPVVARDTSDGLSDGPFLLGVCWALVFGTRAVAAGGGWGFFKCGLAAGCAYLVRPEGLVVPVAGVAVAGYALLRGAWSARTAITAVVTVIVGTLLVGGPYMLLIGGVSNKTPILESASLAAPPVVGPPFAKSIDDVEWAKKLALVIQACVEEWFKAAHYGIAGFAMLGLVLTLPRVRREPRFWLPMAFGVAHLGVLVFLGCKKLYVSERHLLPVVLVGVVFAVGGLATWFRLWSRVPVVGPVFCWRHWPTLTALALAASCLPPLARPLHENRTGHKLAGLKLREELDRVPDAGVVVIDHYEWAQFFSGRSLYRVPPDPPDAEQRVVFVVLELKDGQPETPVFRSDRHKAAVGVFNDDRYPLEWVYQWPENEPRERVKVVLVKQVRR